jgi:hypothetical protein
MWKIWSKKALQARADHPHATGIRKTVQVFFGRHAGLAEENTDQQPKSLTG